MCAFSKRNCLGLQNFLPLTQSLLVFAARSYWGLFSWHEPWAEGPGVGLGHLTPELLSTTCGCGTSPFHICAPPIRLHGCGFFNSIVVRLPFNSTSDCLSDGCSTFLVVILMWLCEEGSHVYLCCHLDRKSPLKNDLFLPTEKESSMKDYI